MADQRTPDRVTSEPVPVPPPADDADRAQAEDVTDRVPGDTLDDRGTFEDPVLSGERNDPDDLTAVSPRESDFSEPAPQPTAFGAATVGGAAAAAAQAGPSREVRDGADPEAEGAYGDRDPDADRDFDANRDLDTERDLDADRARDDLDTERGPDADHDPHTERDLDAERDLDVDREPVVERALDTERELDADRAAEERAYGEAAEQPLDGPSDVADTPAVVDTPADAAATEVEQPIAALWGAETTQGYRDRWREVQLRFVDDPPGAAREANVLVEEAVGALTAELSRQKESLSGWSGEDTEDLRAVVRRHRDFLDRLLGL